MSDTSIEDGEWVMSHRTGRIGIVLQSQRQFGERFLRIRFDDDGVEWIEAGEVELAPDPVSVLSEEYFS